MPADFTTPYSFIIDGTVAWTRTLHEVEYIGPHSYDMRVVEPESIGWMPVVIAPRPTDTATTTWEANDPVMVSGSPTVTWSERTLTHEEIEERNQASVEAQLTEDVKTDNPKLEALIADLATILGSNATPGSVRSWRSTVTNTYDPAVLRALADILIAMAQAQRSSSRQLLRVARVQSRQLSSSDVGTE